MISKNCLMHLRRLAGIHGPVSRVEQTTVRTMATITTHPPDVVIASSTFSQQLAPPSTKTGVTTTIYSFPTLDSLRFEYYPKTHLLVPMRRDILHRAVIFEGDATRQGTASTKWRDDVHGSHRKNHPQKGTGRARAGDKQTPIRRGGGVAFGPKPRDFSTGLNRKIYDLAWRMALSYRYMRGELVVVDKMHNPLCTQGWYLEQIFEKNGWGKRDRRSLLIAANKADKEKLFEGMEEVGKHGKILEAWDVDVKDLLERGRVVIEKKALDMIFKEHSSDLGKPHGMARPVLTDNLLPSDSV